MVLIRNIGVLAGIVPVSISIVLVEVLAITRVIRAGISVEIVAWSGAAFSGAMSHFVAVETLNRGWSATVLLVRGAISILIIGPIILRSVLIIVSRLTILSIYELVKPSRQHINGSIGVVGP